MYERGFHKMVKWSYFVFINIFAFIMMGLDKRKAKKKQWRTPESTLFLIAAAGGGIGAWVGMYMFHHKKQALRNSLFSRNVFIEYRCFLGKVVCLILRMVFYSFLVCALINTKGAGRWIMILNDI